MITFEQLYKELTKGALENNLQQRLEKIKKGDYNEHHLDCLINPDKYSPVWQIDNCKCASDTSKCIDSCPFDAIKLGENTIEIDNKKCTGCGLCIDACDNDNLTYSRDIVHALNILNSHSGPVYALVAPAFVGQFGEDITPGKLRSILKKLGFTGMIEVATFADILTLKEALEFKNNVKNIDDFQLTSCCCPIWISLIKKVYSQIVGHLPASVSPMIACGRVVKKLNPDAATIFIGPCVAKKAEAKEEDIKDAIDCVLTFKEMADILNEFGTDINEVDDAQKEHSSYAGRVYARTGGVSDAVEKTLERIDLTGDIKIKTRQANGVKNCKEMLNDILEGKGDANFFEGMACNGGCVGGPKVIIPSEQGKNNVDEYSNMAEHKTPLDNPYVTYLLNELGIKSVDNLLDDSDIFTRTLK